MKSKRCTKSRGFDDKNDLTLAVNPKKVKQGVQTTSGDAGRRQLVLQRENHLTPQEFCF